MKKTIKFSALIAASALALAACGSGDSGEEDNPYNLITPGELTVSTSGDQPPFSMSESGGDTSGFIIDITDRVAEELDLDVEYAMAPSSAGLQGLTSDRYDMVANGLGVTDERKESVDFAKGLYWSKTAMLAKKSETGSSMSDFNGKRVGVITGSVQAGYLENQLPEATAVDFDKQNSAVSTLTSGSIAGFMVGGPDADRYLQKFDGLKIAASQPVDHATTVAFQKGNTELTDAFNGEVQKMIDSGEYTDIYKKYFTEAPEAELYEIWPGLKDEF